MSKPRKGQKGLYRTQPGEVGVTFLIHRADENLCWATYEEPNASPDPVPFIWKHVGGLNTLHWWPGKPEGQNARMPGPAPDFTRADLDIRIIEQAAYYGLSVADYSRRFGEMCRGTEDGLAVDSDGNRAGG